MISKNYFDNVPEPKSNILHNSYEKNLTSLSSDNCSEGHYINFNLFILHNIIQDNIISYLSSCLPIKAII